MRVTDLNQAVVYGIETDEIGLAPDFHTSFHYDSVFGTVINRFIVQAVIGMPLTVYGKGRQTRGVINIRDTLRCVELAALNPARPGEFRVFNQVTQQFSMNELSEMVIEAAAQKGIHVEAKHIANPRTELEQHYYNVKHRALEEPRSPAAPADDPGPRPDDRGRPAAQEQHPSQLDPAEHHMAGGRDAGGDGQEARSGLGPVDRPWFDPIRHGELEVMKCDCRHVGIAVPPTAV